MRLNNAYSRFPNVSAANRFRRINMEIITKVPVYAVERIEAMKRVGFKKSTKLLVGTIDGYAYKDYWTINR